jgi:hypothetical protein
VNYYTKEYILDGENEVRMAALLLFELRFTVPFAFSFHIFFSLYFLHHFCPAVAGDSDVKTPSAELHVDARGPRWLGNGHIGLGTVRK